MKTTKTEPAGGTRTDASPTEGLKAVVEMVRDNSKTLATIAEKQKRIDDLETQVRQIQETVRRGSISLPGTEDAVKSGKFRYARAINAVHKGNMSLAPDEWDISKECMKRMSGEVQTRLHTTLTDSVGGFLIPEEISGTLVPKLDAESVMISKMGVTVVNPRGVPFRVNKITGGLTAYMIGESSRPTESTLTLGQVNFNPKKCAARAVITNEQVMWGTPQTDGIVMDDLARRIALKEDQQIMAGKGTENEATGIVPAGATAAPTGFTTVAAQSSTGTKVLFGDLNLALAKLAEADALGDDVRMVMHPRVKYALMRQFFQGVSTVATEEGGAGFLAGMPFISDARFREITGITVAHSTQMSVAYNTDDTWIFIGANKGFSDYWFARFGGMVLAKSDVATDGTYHGFTDDIVHCKAVTWFDGGAVRPATICIVTGYDYALIAD